MSVDTIHLMRRTDPSAPLRDLDDVRVLASVVTLDGDTIPAGTEGTVVAVWGAGEASEVEFSEPLGPLATVGAAQLARTERAIP
ncbi:hypothetical protein AFCDBAGC_1377 [Methylobacterium cerastii]|uniref:DUF4926 domain-containing protein n=1 Tax=Methylobacterium cerastii TaxID=932741 RepID=A0ABQ4QFC4_9HYPH|nr:MULTISPECIES: DUF4926 domain-containing protein [Methylobacterium]TXN83843.1 DUF4926 domain-containing protein [Methylobacterium sp. WL8]GJD43525.1 hypothetical protein AFCDBAGC_1377 [Methylobacterium cerastii]